MIITLTLIASTSGISLAALYINRELLNWGMLRPYRTVREKSWHELVSSGFLHANFGHLFVNMFVLFFFGGILEDSLGAFHFIGLYFSGILISSLPSLFKFRNDPTYATLGASGAVESVLFAFIFLFPTEKLMLILLPIPIPAWLFGILFIAYSVFESKRRRGRVNHEAHIAGALWGILYMLLFVPGGLDHILTIISRF
ncbi:MAG: rhomboid family intramembrane serine protease [Balneolaceae bacterium]